MPEYLNQEDAYLRCKRDGKIITVESIDIERIKSTLIIAMSDARAAEILRKSLSDNDAEWNGVYKLYYDALHELSECFLRFERVKSGNHQCLFAYLCAKHPELELSWEFFEMIRTRRNGINYYGSAISHKEWKAAELQFRLYTNRLKEEVKKRIIEYDKGRIE
jgi:hypothetical protein